MKLHEIKKCSEIFVAKLVDGVNMSNINENDNIMKLKFKRIITKKATTHFAEWCIERTVDRKIDCVNGSPFDIVGAIAVFSENSKDEMFIALVKPYDMQFYVNY